MVSDKSFVILNKIIFDQFILNPLSDHGPDHWQRVEEIGLHLAKPVKADTEIIRLFALLHDSQRACEGYDPEHGFRAAEYVWKLFQDGLIVLDRPRLEQLAFACRYHNSRTTKSRDITVNICWDSDRIDLTRVGVSRSDIKLITQVAQDYILHNQIH